MSLQLALSILEIESLIAKRYRYFESHYILQNERQSRKNILLFKSEDNFVATLFWGRTIINRVSQCYNKLTRKRKM